MREMTPEEISSILESKLPPEEKSQILKSHDWSKNQIEDTKANTKNSKDNDGKPERNTGMKANAKEKELVDPLGDEERSSILDSKLPEEEKFSLLKALDLSTDEPRTCSIPSRVELEEKVQHVETKPKEGNRGELRTDVSLPQAKEKVALDLKPTSDEKPSSLMSNRNEGIGVPSSGVELKEKNQHTETEAKPEHDPIPAHENGLQKSIYKGSSLRSQQAPGEDCHLLLDLKEHILVIAKEIIEPRTNPEGGDAETIYIQDAICKKCCERLFDEDNVLKVKDENVLKAKCKCKLALIHKHCAEKWRDERGSKCLACQEEIKYIYVDLKISASSSSSSPQKNNVGKREQPSTDVPKRSWCCFSA